MQYKQFIRRNSPQLQPSQNYQPTPQVNPYTQPRPIEKAHNFELFEKSSKGNNRRGIAKPYVNIYSHKFIYFRGGMIEKVFNELPEDIFIKILYDKKKNTIGFLFSKDKSDSAFSLSKPKKNRSFHIVTGSFFKFYNENNKNGDWNGNYEPKKQYIEGFGDVWTIDLNHKMTK